MRRIMLLVLLALALPAAADNVVLYAISPAQFGSGTFTLAPPNFDVSVQSTGLLTIKMVGITTLTSGCLPPGRGCFFRNGFVQVTSSTNTLLFQSSMYNGVVSSGIDSLSIRARFIRNSQAPHGGTVMFSVRLGPGNSLLGGSAVVIATPEPTTLLSFGTGVLGLVGMIRRKLKRGA